MLDFIAIPFSYILRFLNGITNNYIASLLLFAVIIELLLSPLAYKKRKSSIAAKKIQPELNAIQNRYNDLPVEEARQKRQDDMIKLYEGNKVSPFGGLSITLIQLPILIALYGVVTRPLKFLCGFSNDAIVNITEKASQILGIESASQIQSIAVIREHFDSFITLHGFTDKVNNVSALPNISVFGYDVTGTASLSNFNFLLLIPLSLFLMSVISTIVSYRTSCSDWRSFKSIIKNPVMLITSFIGPLLSTFISFTIPATVVLYWIFSSFASMIINIVFAIFLPMPDVPIAPIKSGTIENSSDTGAGDSHVILPNDDTVTHNTEPEFSQCDVQNITS